MLFVIVGKLLERNAPFLICRNWVLAAVVRKIKYVEHFQNADEVANVVTGLVRLSPRNHFLAWFSRYFSLQPIENAVDVVNRPWGNLHARIQPASDIRDEVILHTGSDENF